MKKVLVSLLTVAVALISCNNNPNPNPGEESVYTSVSLYPETLNLTNDDDQITLQFVYEPATAPYPENIVWESSNPDVVRLLLTEDGEYDGTILAMNAGEATVTATVGKQVASCRIKVQDRSEAFQPGSLRPWNYEASPIATNITIPNAQGEDDVVELRVMNYVLAGDKFTETADGDLRGRDYMAFLAVPTYMKFDAAGKFQYYYTLPAITITDDASLAKTLGYCIAGDVLDPAEYSSFFFNLLNTGNADWAQYNNSLTGTWLTSGEVQEVDGGSSMSYNRLNMAALANGSKLANVYDEADNEVFCYSLDVNWILDDRKAGLYGVAIELQPGEDGEEYMVGKEPAEFVSYKKHYENHPEIFDEAAETPMVKMGAETLLSDKQVKQMMEQSLNMDKLYKAK